MKENFFSPVFGVFQFFFIVFGKFQFVLFFSFDIFSSFDLFFNDYVAIKGKNANESTIFQYFAKNNWCIIECLHL